MNDQGDTSQSLGPGHPLQSSAEDAGRISATVPIALTHRPLKFRAWDSVRKEMVHDFCVTAKGGRYVIRWSDERNEIINMHYAQKGSLPGDFGEIDYTDWYAVKCLSIMQFSGLQDKHRKDIYEGDIVRRSDALPMNGRECVRIPMAPQRVFFSEGAFRLRRSSKSTKFPLHSSVIRQNGIEVIGNIYENPELLR